MTKDNADEGCEHCAGMRQRREIQTGRRQAGQTSPVKLSDAVFIKTRAVSPAVFRVNVEGAWRSNIIKPEREGDESASVNEGVVMCGHYRACAGCDACDTLLNVPNLFQALEVTKRPHTGSRRKTYVTNRSD